MSTRVVTVQVSPRSSRQLTAAGRHSQYVVLLQEGCSLAAVPELLAALTALTRLNLSVNSQMDGSWPHLLPLT